MADNVAITPGSGATVAADLVSSVLYQRVKISVGDDGTVADMANGAGAVGASVPRVTLASDDPAVASLSVLDDWDETNRAAVNLIASQVGITGNTGVVGAACPRVTIATDDAVSSGIVILKNCVTTSRCAVNPISGQSGVAAGTGVDGATVQRVTLATDVGLPAGETHVGQVGGQFIRVAVEQTRPANTTAYGVGDVVSNDATTTTPLDFASFSRVNSGSGIIRSARIATDKKSIVPAFRVHLYSVTPTTPAGDNLPFVDLYADESKKIGSFDFPIMATGTDTTNSDCSFAEALPNLPFIASSTKHVFAVLETLTAFTPASSEKFTLTLHADVN